jgi:hypothetical protein
MNCLLSRLRIDQYRIEFMRSNWLALLAAACGGSTMASSKPFLFGPLRSPPVSNRSPCKPDSMLKQGDG